MARSIGVAWGVAYHSSGKSGEPPRGLALAKPAGWSKPPPVRCAMLLAAGKGERLLPLTRRVPKPLVPIGDRALVLHSLEQLARAGLKRAVLNTHYLSEPFSEVLRHSPISVEVSHEPELLGTAGGIHRAHALLGDSEVLVMNGDIWFAFDLAPYVSRLSGGRAVCVLAAPAQGKGTLGIGPRQSVTRLRDQVFGTVTREGDYVGVCLLSREARALLPTKGCLVGDFMLPYLRQGGEVGVVWVDGRWVDVGTPERYLEANLAWLGQRAYYRGDGAIVEEGASVARSVLGEGSRVTGEARVSESVLWPGARARGPLHRAVVMDQESEPVLVAGLSG